MRPRRAATGYSGRALDEAIVSPPRPPPLGALPLLLLAGGCYPRLSIEVPAADDTGPADGGSPDGGGSDGGGGTGFVALDSLLPGDGPTSGDTVVEVLGGPFDDTAVVRFGDRDATIDLIEADRLMVRSPSATDAGMVDVTVEVTGASASRPDGWTYWTDADGDAVLLGTWLQLELANRGTWTGVGPTFDAWVRFTQATDSEPWQRYGVAMDSCGDPADTLSSLQGPDEILFGYSSTLLSLTWDKARQEYTYPAISAPDPQVDAPLQLQATRSGQSPPLALTEVVRTPPWVTVTGPDLAASTVPEMKYVAASVTWVPASFHHVMIIVGVGETASFLCMAQDDGELTIPSARLDELPWESTTGSEASAEVWLAVVGVSTGTTELEWTDGEARFDAGLGLIGRVRFVGGPEMAP